MLQAHMAAMRVMHNCNPGGLAKAGFDGVWGP